MSKRSTQVLTRKLREAEDAYVASLRRDLDDMIGRLERRVRRQQSNADLAGVLLEGLSEMVTRTFAQGVLLLREFTVETGVAVDRDARAVSANAGVDLDDVMAEWEPFGWEAGAMDYWEMYVTGVIQKGGVEIKRQADLARGYDDDFMEGFLARMFSKEPLRRHGRGGMGLFPSLVSVLVGGITTPAYSMVNQQKAAAYFAMVEVANA